MWLIIKYSPTTLFSLKNSSATNSAGKSLLTPSPYSVKMALLNAIITFDGLKTAKDHFNLIRDLEMRFSLPESLIVNNCLIRILKDNDKASKEVKIDKPFKTTVAFREYVYFGDDIEIAVNISSASSSLLEDINFLKKWFMHIHYFGKKGCFFQFQYFEEVKELNDSKYCTVISEGFSPGVFMQMDDIDGKADFESMNNYNQSKKAKAQRMLKVYSFPVSLKKMSKSYSFYGKI